MKNLWMVEESCLGFRRSGWVCSGMGEVSDRGEGRREKEGALKAGVHVQVTDLHLPSFSVISTFENLP